MPRRKARRDRPKAPVYAIDHNGIAPYLREFLTWSESMNYSAQTVKDRRYALTRFIAWCDERGLTRPQDITKPILERYRRYLYHYRKNNGKPLGFSTQASFLHAIKAFFKWLAQENHILYNPASELDVPRVHRQLPRHILNHAEVEAILNQTSLNGEIGVRDRAIIETLYSTGMRRMECQNLTLYDLDLEQGTVLIREGKGKKDRYIPIGERACAWIRKYVEDVRPALVLEPDEGYVFISDLGTPFRNNQLSDLVKKYLARAGIDKPGACHLFRHAMATQMLENGADIRFIQAMLGHADLSSTQVYTQVSIKKLKASRRCTRSPIRRTGAIQRLPMR